MTKSQKKKVSNRQAQMSPGEVVDTFFLSFIGELVELAGSFYHGEQEAALKVVGYILDMDDNYYYLGDTHEEITQAIKKDRVIYIQVLNPVNQFEEMLTQMEVPKDESQKN